jgi:hypothetical protein
VALEVTPQLDVDRAVGGGGRVRQPVVGGEVQRDARAAGRIRQLDMGRVIDVHLRGVAGRAADVLEQLLALVPRFPAVLLVVGMPTGVSRSPM